MSLWLRKRLISNVRYVAKTRKLFPYSTTVAVASDRKVVLPLKQFTLGSNIQANASCGATMLLKVYDPYAANVTLLLHPDGAPGSTVANDMSTMGNAITFLGTAAVATSKPLFGGGSFYFDGASNMEVANNGGFTFGAADFTVEFWGAFTQNGWHLALNGASGEASAWTMANDGAGASALAGMIAYIASANTLPVSDTWQHYAFVRSGTQLALYLDGATITPTDITGYTFDVCPRPLTIGASQDTAGAPGATMANVVGHMSEIRITKGVARYTGNFTPLAGRFPDPGGVPKMLAANAVASPAFWPGTGYKETTALQASASVTAYLKDFWLLAAGAVASAAVLFARLAESHRLRGIVRAVPSLTAVMNLDPYLDPYIDNVVLLVQGDHGVGGPLRFQGSAPPNKSLWDINGGPTLNTTNKIFTPGALDFATGGVAMTYTTSPEDIAFGEGDLTIEFWVYRPAGYAQYCMALYAIKASPTGQEQAWFVNIDYVGRPSLVLTGEGNASSTVTMAYDPDDIYMPYDMWNHVAFTVREGAGTVYLNGVPCGWGDTLAPAPAAGTVQIGMKQSQSGVRNQYFVGLLDDIRITKGIARYSDSFVPRTKRISETRVPARPAVILSAAASSVGSITAELASPVGVKGLGARIVAVASLAGVAGAKINTSSSGTATAAATADLTVTTPTAKPLGMETESVAIASANLSVVAAVARPLAAAAISVPNVGLARLSVIPLISLEDPYFGNIVLMSNGATAANANFVDISPKHRQPINPCTITRGVEFAYYGPTSMYFNGVNDYLEIPNTGDFTFGAEDFTLELWTRNEYQPNGTQGTAVLIGQQDMEVFSSSLRTLAWGIWLPWRQTPAGEFHTVSGQHLPEINATAVNWTGQWAHVVLMRLGGSLRLFIDGVGGSTVTLTGSTDCVSSSHNIIIGAAKQPGGYTNFFKGYIDGIRFTRGVARYPMNTSFTPPAVAFNDASFVVTSIDPYYANIELLLHFDGIDGGVVFADSGPKGRTTTAVATAALSSVARRFGTTSVMFNGTDDYLYGTAYQGLGAGDFTIEVWVFTPALGGTQTIFSTRDASGSVNTFSLAVTATGEVRVYTDANLLTTTGAGVQASTWVNITLVRYNQVLSVYVGGINKGSASSTNDFNTTNYTFGSLLSGGGDFWNGYIDEFRMSRGIARYTANFVVQSAAFANTATEPTPSNRAISASVTGSAAGAAALLVEAGKAYLWANVVTNATLNSDGLTSYLADPNSDPFYLSTALLLQGEPGGNSPIVDTGFGHRPVVAVNHARVKTDVVHGGAGALYFGSYGYATIEGSDGMCLGAADFTIEGWARLYDAGAGALTGAITHGGMNAGQHGWMVTISSWGGIRFDFADGSASIEISGYTSMRDQWNHFAVERTSSGIRVYLNGLFAAGDPTYIAGGYSIFTGTYTFANFGTAPLLVGAYQNTTGGLVVGDGIPGYIDDLRITIGVARYGSNFTPPARMPSYGGVVNMVAIAANAAARAAGDGLLSGSVAPVWLGATATATATITTSVIADKRLSAAPATTGNATPDLAVQSAIQVPLAANASGSTTLAGMLGASTILFANVATAGATLSGGLTYKFTFAAACNCVMSTSGDMILSVPMAAGALSAATLTPDVRGVVPLAAALVSVAASTAGGNLTAVLGGNSAATATSGGTVSVGVRLGGAALVGASALATAQLGASTASAAAVSASAAADILITRLLAASAQAIAGGVGACTLAKNMAVGAVAVATGSTNITTAKTIASDAQCTAAATSTVALLVLYTPDTRRAYFVGADPRQIVVDDERTTHVLAWV